MKHYLVYFALVAIFASCKTITPNFPNTPTDSLENIKPPISKIGVPVSVDFSGSLAQVNNEINTFFPIGESGPDECKEPQYSFALDRDRSVPVDISLADGAGPATADFNVNARLAVGAQANFCPLCVRWLGGCIGRLRASCGYGGESLRRFDFGIATPIDIGSNYHLTGTAIRLTNLRFIDPCRITFLNLDITGVIQSFATRKLPALLSKLNGPISGVSLESPARRAWEILSDKIKLQNDLYLLLNPESISKGPITGSGYVVNLLVGLHARPEIVTSIDSPVIKNPLPPLGQSAPDSGFNIYSSIKLDYEFLNKQLNTALVGQEFSELNQKIIIKSVKLYPTNYRRVIFRVNVKGSQRGYVYFIAKPTYDSATRTISFSEFDYDVKTKNFLINALAWIAKPFIINTIRDRAKMNIGPVVDIQIKNINTAFENNTDPNVSLAGTKIETINIVDNNFQFTKKHLSILAHAAGKIKVAINL